MRLLAALLLTSVSLSAQPARRATPPQAPARPPVTSPLQEFGHEIGADYVLPNYTRLHRYWQKLARESNRMELDTIGTTAEGRPQIMAIVSSPANLARVDRYRTIARRLAQASGVDSAQAMALARDGKAIIWIDGGLHATEVLGAQQLTQTLYEMVSRTDEETMRILRDVVILFVHANPDGMELVSDWYMREPEPTKRSTAGVPRLYQKYIGHDNNRDFYMSTQPETENMNRAMYREWFPQIMYNHHQTGPAGTVLFAPPFRDPFNYNYDPLIPLWIDLVGANMHARFVLEGKPGSTMRSGANYSTWWNGGLRTTAYFHNIIGLLTETIGNPTPIQIPFIPSLQLPRGDMPAPIAPQSTWKFRRSVEYSVTANRSLLDLASRHREQLLFNIWRMGMNSIERGSRDHWTTMPDDIDRVAAMVARDSAAAGARPDSGRLSESVQQSRTVPTRYFDAVLRDPARRDPRGYIIPSSQPDFPTATKFVEALLENGITVHRASAAFEVGGTRYPAGSYVVLAAQAFRPHVRDMFEPQNHPNDFPYPGGPPRPPYDNAGYTLAYQMGIQFDRILDGFTGPFQPISLPIAPPAGRVLGAGSPPGWLFSLRPNNASSAAIRLLTAGEDVWRVDGEARAGGQLLGHGAYWVRAGTSTAALVRKYADSLGLDFHASAQPAGARRIGTPRIALWDRYGGSMPSGWVRWILEQNGFPYTVVYPKELDAGNLNAKYDVIVFVDEAIPERDDPRAGQGPFSLPAERIPGEFHDRLGVVTVATTVPQLRTFLMNGGTVLTIGRSTSLASHLGLPIASALMNRRASPPRALTRQEFYIPGSLLRVSVDTTRPIAQGMPSELDVLFDESPAFTLPTGAAAPGARVERVAWFASPKPLRSGWAWGQEHLDGAVAIAEATVGKGKLYLFGPEITFRAQPHGTFKFLFNGLLLSAPR